MHTDLTDDEIEHETRRIGRRIRDVREHHNLTQEAVFLAVPMSRNHFQAIEAGRANPTLRTLVRIAHAIGVPVEETRPHVVVKGARRGRRGSIRPPGTWLIGAPRVRR